jgi:endonuclease YncB( thermonuclease family)
MRRRPGFPGEATVGSGATRTCPRLQRSAAGALALAAALAPVETLAARLSGRPVVIDGGTLRLAGEVLRLRRVEAPALEQVCVRDDGTEAPCGREAKEALDALLGADPVDCVGRGRDREGRFRLADCELADAGTDVATALLERGWAVASPCYGGRPEHREAELRARYHRRGLWAYWFEAPWLYRNRVHPTGRPPRRCERRPIAAGVPGRPPEPRP